MKGPFCDRIFSEVAIVRLIAVIVEKQLTILIFSLILPTSLSFPFVKLTKKKTALDFLF